MNEVTDRLTSREGPPPPRRWKARDSLALVPEVNQRCVAAVASHLDAVMLAGALPCVTENRELWAKLDADALRALAELPFVIVDFCFKDADLWRADGCVSPDLNGGAPSGLPLDVSSQLTQEILMFAWQTARWSRLAAQMLFGMRADVVRSIATLSPERVRIKAIETSVLLRLRWQEDAQLWGDWMTAAIANDHIELAGIRRHLELRFCGELV